MQTNPTQPSQSELNRMVERLAHDPEVQAAATDLRPENFDRWMTSNLARLLRKVGA